MITKVIYEDGVLKLLEKLDLPGKTKLRVRVTVRVSFSKLVEELGVIEAKEDIDPVLVCMRTRNYYG